MEFFSLFINKIYTYSLFLSNGCNKNVMFLILKLSNLFLISLNLKTPNFISIYSYFMSSNWFILFLQVFYYMVLIFHSLKVYLQIIFSYLVTYCCLKLLLFENSLVVLSFYLFFFWSLSMFWSHLNVFGYEDFSNLRQTWKTSSEVFSEVF